VEPPQQILREITKRKKKKKSMKHVCNHQRHQHKKISNSLIQNLSITGRRRCWRHIKTLSLTQMKDCHEKQTKKWEGEDTHHGLQEKKKGEN